MAESLRATNTQYPLVAMVSQDLSSRSIDCLRRANIKIRQVRGKYVLPPNVLRDIGIPRWKATFAKLEVFDLTEYDKVVFIDGDMLINRNIDLLFEAPHPSAAVYYGRVKPFAHFNFPNSGLMVLHPEEGLAKKIFNCWPAVSIKHSTFGDQDLLHHFYRSIWEKRYGSWELPVTYNACAFILDGIIKKHGLNAHFSAPDAQTVAVVHFSSPRKPWTMTRRFVAYLFARKLAIGKWREVKAYRRYFSILKRVRRSSQEV